MCTCPLLWYIYPPTVLLKLRIKCKVGLLWAENPSGVSAALSGLSFLFLLIWSAWHCPTRGHTWVHPYTVHFTSSLEGLLARTNSFYSGSNMDVGEGWIPRLCRLGWHGYLHCIAYVLGPAFRRVCEQSSPRVVTRSCEEEDEAVPACDANSGAITPGDGRHLKGVNPRTHCPHSDQCRWPLDARHGERAGGNSPF